MSLPIPKQKVWLFQSNPKRYNSVSELKDGTIKEGTWTVTRYQQEISSGDIGILWISGKRAGIYAIFDIISDPQVIVDESASRKYWIDKNEADIPQLRIKYRYKFKLSKPLLKSEILKIVGLKDLLILKQPQATNFPVTDEQWNIISQEIVTRSSSLSEESYNVDSWTLIGSNVAVKKMDRSSFYHHGTGIPKEKVRDFFNLKNAEAGYRCPITLIYRNTPYTASLRYDQQPNPRTQLHWHSDFEKIIRSVLPTWYQYFSNNKDLSSDSPEMRLVKTGQSDEYLIEFIEPNQIEQDSIDDIGDAEEQKLLQEGKIQYYFGKRFERIPKNRQRAIEIHGSICSICGFDFERVYGERGRGFIEIHHIKPLNLFSTEEYVNPETDLFPVCANCHRMIHRKIDSILTIEEMKKIING